MSEASVDNDHEAMLHDIIFVRHFYKNDNRWINLYQHSETLKIGKIYKGIREAMGLSQEDVSAGLMSAKALSRFENDENYPNSYMMQILFERSRKIIKAFYFYVV